jgi:hypothetical protein
MQVRPTEYTLPRAFRVLPVLIFDLRDPRFNRRADWPHPETPRLISHTARSVEVTLDPSPLVTGLLGLGLFQHQAGLTQPARAA